MLNSRKLQVSIVRLWRTVRPASYSWSIRFWDGIVLHPDQIPDNPIRAASRARARKQLPRAAWLERDNEC